MYAEEILYLPIRELGNRLRRRDLSPVELAESYLDRARRWDRDSTLSSPSRPSWRWSKRTPRRRRSRPVTIADHCTAFPTR